MTHIPSYIRIKDYIIENIKRGNYKPGGKVPSEKELGELFNVSRITATTAIRDLVGDGIVFRIQGKGTFVADKKEEDLRSHKAYGFENNSSLNEGHHETIIRRTIKAEKELSSKMKVNEKDELYEIIRTKVIDEKVNAIEYVYLPVKYYVSLDIDNEDISLIHDLVEKHCFLKQKRAKVYVEPILPTQEQANMLKINKENPVLLWEKFTFSEEEKIIEYSRNIINSDLYRFYMDLDLEKNSSVG
ncbi:MAG: GntR family transcriptional regulator [Eubacteriales bacterium]|nr:GntR family transcriptional regulator [Eubacteriales bacterium]